MKGSIAHFKLKVYNSQILIVEIYLEPASYENSFWV